MGLLNKKQRVVDTVFTQEGRKQVSQGRLRASYVSFTDAEMFYDSDVISGSADTSNRLTLEASFNLPQDSISLDCDDSGRLLPIQLSSSMSLVAGQLVTRSVISASSAVLSGTTYVDTFISGDTFSSAVDDLVLTTPQHVSMNMLVGSYDPVFDDVGYGVSPSSITFKVTDSSPLPDADRWSVDINDLPSFFSDVKFSRLRNFKYMPPVNKRIESQAVQPLGTYARLGAPDVSDEKLEAELNYFRKKGFHRQLTVSPTTRDNNTILQVYERGKSIVKKLDAVPFGKVTISGVEKDVFFIGYVMNDDLDNPTFIHLFTVMAG